MFHFLVVIAVLLMAASASVKAEAAPWFCHGLDCPEFTNSSVDSIEVREYGSALWSSTQVLGVDLDDAVSTGFDRLFDYISGANEAEKAIDMTAPVLVKVEPGAGPNCNTTFTISFFVPFEYQPPNSPPPAPTSTDVFTQTIDAQKVAVKSFGGMSKGNVIITEAAALENEVNKAADLTEADGESWWFAGYDPPFRLSDRHNEVWINVQ